MKPTKEETAAVLALLTHHPEYSRALLSMRLVRETIGVCPLPERNRAIGFLAEILSSPVPLDAQSVAANPAVMEEQAIGHAHAQRFVRMMKGIFSP